MLMQAKCKTAALQTLFALGLYSLHVAHIAVPQTCMCVALWYHGFARVLQCVSHSLHFAGTLCMTAAKSKVLVAIRMQSMQSQVCVECKVCGSVCVIAAKYADQSLHACCTKCKFVAMRRVTSLHVYHIKVPQVCMRVASKTLVLACA